VTAEEIALLAEIARDRSDFTARRCAGWHCSGRFR
jgi:hypothetical protein